MSNLGYLSQGDIESWNNMDCSSALTAGEYYCVAFYADSTSLPMPSTANTPPSSTQAGIISTCKSWYLATDGDSCDLIPLYFGTFDESTFLSWNPALGGTSCTGLVVGTYYCVAGKSCCAPVRNISTPS